MALVDYCSSDSEDDQESPSYKKSRSSGDDPLPSSKRPKLSNPEPLPPLPPLPPAFYDLYASTVRTTTTDTPSLHQGRTRQVPHVTGNWPSFLYIEWIPPPAAFDLLSSLLTTLQSSIPSVTSFLTNDLHVRQPLHISLSRTLSLATSEKDSFLREVQTAISKSNIRPFRLKVTSVEWHRTSESGRSFLVLRVVSSAATSNPNTELAALLGRCNQVCKLFSQPELYSWADDSGSNAQSVSSEFHVSIGWSFSEPTEDVRRATEKVFGSQQVREQVEKELQIQVESVKARIGNVVTNTDLGSSSGKRKIGGLFGMGL
ncbi:hypothetical protein QBC43DRAFT_313344 [Cladorrhinum sp. PSN259]|nr:hypothetical protein QBC43DRAFT_313344 [Cladorrhinum sp. PSN259]